jgi:CheY-like chemotaxis protein
MVRQFVGIPWVSPYDLQGRTALRILVVEDEASMAELLRKRLEEEHHLVIAASTDGLRWRSPAAPT